LVPKVGVKPPTDLEGIPYEAIRVDWWRGVAPEVLDTSGSGYPLALQFDKGPPTRSPGSPATFHTGDDGSGLFPALSLPTHKAHHLRKAVHCVQAVKVMIIEGLEAQAPGEKSSHA
jgi:hypothetical protein